MARLRSRRAFAVLILVLNVLSANALLARGHDGTRTSAVCNYRANAARCNDARHFGALLEGAAGQSRPFRNEAKCNDMRHFGVPAGQQYTVVC